METMGRARTGSVESSQVNVQPGLRAAALGGPQSWARAGQGAGRDRVLAGKGPLRPSWDCSVVPSAGSYHESVTWLGLCQGLRS